MGCTPVDEVARMLIRMIREYEHELSIEQHGGGVPLLVALDGRSGTGKSTLARAVGEPLSALVIDGDDFYAGGTDAYWAGLDPEEKVAHVIDWRRQREVLENLRRRQPATWRPYDWESDDGSFGPPVSCSPADIVILDGAYSARSELADLFTRRVLLDVPPDVRRARLLRREGAQYRDEWESRWSDAEDLYFDALMPRGAFDFVIDLEGRDG
jgi:uridine kinase